MRRFLVCGVMALASASCSYDSTTRYYASERFAARPVETVKVLHDAPNRPYEVIADFQDKGGSEKEMQEKAAQIGADAVIVTRPAELVPIWNERPDEASHHNPIGNTIFATAIRFKAQ